MNISASISPIDLSISTMKHVGAQWLVEAFDYIQENPSIIIDGFIKSARTFKFYQTRYFKSTLRQILRIPS